MPLMNDHAKVKKFGLKVFQQPTADELLYLSKIK
jgi:hypothetical protein